MLLTSLALYCSTLSRLFHGIKACELIDLVLHVYRSHYLQEHSITLAHHIKSSTFLCLLELGVNIVHFEEWYGADMRQWDR